MMPEHAGDQRGIRDPGRLPGPGPRGRTGRLRRGVLAVVGAGAIAVCVSVMRPAPASSQRAINLPASSVVPTTTPATTTATTAVHSTTPATASGTTTATTTGGGSSQSRTTYSTRGPTYTSPSTAATTTTVAPTTTTTLAPLGGGGIPAPPSTLPLTTKQQNGHVNPVFAELSGVGFFLVVVLISAQAILTRRGGRGRSL